MNRSFRARPTLGVAGLGLIAGLVAPALADEPPAHGHDDKPTARAEPKTKVPPPASKAGSKKPDPSPNHDDEHSPSPATPAPKAHEGNAEASPADESIRRLREGNERWADGTVKNPRADESRRKDTAENGQKPFAAVLTCADSRIPVERAFDCGVGDVFVLRVAGNVAGPHEAGSLEYAVEHLHVPVIVVMGHTKCGAVAAAASNAAVDGNVPSLIQEITPAVERVKRLRPELDPKELASASVQENVWQTVFQLLKSSDAVRSAVDRGEIKVVGAVYDIADGKTTWLGEHPWQAELVAAFRDRSPRDHREAAHDEPARDDERAPHKQ